MGVGGDGGGSVEYEGGVGGEGVQEFGQYPTRQTSEVGDEAFIVLGLPLSSFIHSFVHSVFTHFPIIHSFQSPESPYHFSCLYLIT